MSIVVKAEPVNGRLIHGYGPGGCLGWAIEFRGPAWHGIHMQCWYGHGLRTLAEAQAVARRLGPLEQIDETTKLEMLHKS